jgi:hypothetical protein
VDIDVTASPGAAGEFAIEASILENQGNRLARDEFLWSNAIRVGDVSSEPAPVREAISVCAPVTTGDDSLKIGGEDRILQLVEYARVPNARLKVGLARRS